MKAFNTLTPQGQIRRYHRLARQALENYSITVKKMRCISNRHNIVFRVDTENDTYALKISYPNVRTRLMVQSEMQWLDDMDSAELDLNFSTPIRTKDDELVVSIKMDGIPAERHIVLMTWLKGRLVSLTPNVKKIRQLGGALATLHNFADDYQPQEVFTQFDDFRCSEWGGLSYLDESHPFLSPEQKALFKQAINITENKLIVARKRDGLKLIHADLHLKNSIWYKNKIAIFDFDDCRWGHYLQDWGVILSWFKEDTHEHKAMRDTFKKGYNRQRTINYSDDDLKYAEMHRRMVGLTFVMNNRPLQRRAASEEVEEWLQGKL